MNGKTKHPANTVFILLLFSLFALSSLSLVLIGANVYRNIVHGMDENSQTRSCFSYVANKVRAAGADGVQLETIDGQQALVLPSSYNGEAYNTYIYAYAGYLTELFTRADNGFTPGSGDKITPVSGFSMAKDGSALVLSMSGSGGARLSMHLNLTESGEGE